NDALDLSGSFVTVNTSTIELVGDKGVSVGEGSTLYFHNLNISSANFGIVAKDNSQVNGDILSIKHTKYGIAAYQKKEEYGYQTQIVLNDATFQHIQFKTFLEKGSRVTINGRKEVANQENVYEALFN
ncbi:MAG: hypothetical protein HRT90_09865, partial [Candidatus Margulisbacteria bacterium]|nr:hypothetical protein [Candidatus Margulisiibacteriota bacterium]